MIPIGSGNGRVPLACVRACVRACMCVDGFCVREIFSASLIRIGKAADILRPADDKTPGATPNEILSLDTMSVGSTF